MEPELKEISDLAKQITALNDTVTGLNIQLKDTCKVLESTQNDDDVFHSESLALQQSYQKQLTNKEAEIRHLSDRVMVAENSILRFEEEVRMLKACIQKEVAIRKKTEQECDEYETKYLELITKVIQQQVNSIHKEEEEEENKIETFAEPQVVEAEIAEVPDEVHERNQRTKDVINSNRQFLIEKKAKSKERHIGWDRSFGQKSPRGTYRSPVSCSSSAISSTMRNLRKENRGTLASRSPPSTYQTNQHRPHHGRSESVTRKNHVQSQLYTFRTVTPKRHRIRGYEAHTIKSRITSDLKEEERRLSRQRSSQDRIQSFSPELF